MEIASRRRVDSTFEAAAGHLGNRGGFASDAIEAEVAARGYDGEYLRYQNARNETGMSSSSSIEAFGKTVAMIRRPSGGVTSFLHKKYIFTRIILLPLCCVNHTIVIRGKSMSSICPGSKSVAQDRLTRSLSPVAEIPLNCTLARRYLIQRPSFWTRRCSFPTPRFLFQERYTLSHNLLLVCISFPYINSDRETTSLR